jgi:acyl-CoA thioesterase I
MKNGINSIVVYGDSILKGVVTGTSDKRFEIVEENSLSLAGKSLGLEITNKSVFGNIITKGKKTLDFDIEKGRIGKRSFDAAIIESGGNDCDHDWVSMSKDPSNPPGHRTPLPEFIEAIDYMVTKFRSFKITPVLMTCPPLVADRYFKNICISANEKVVSTFLGGDIFHLYRTQELYSLALADYARSNDVQLVDMHRAFLEAEYDLSGSFCTLHSMGTVPDSQSCPAITDAGPQWSHLMCADGIHPNLDGYKFMAGVWEQELPKLKKEF